MPVAGQPWPVVRDLWGGVSFPRPGWLAMVGRAKLNVKPIIRADRAPRELSNVINGYPVGPG